MPGQLGSKFTKKPALTHIQHQKHLAENSTVYHNYSIKPLVAKINPLFEHTYAAIDI